MKGTTIQADKTRMLRFSINTMIEYKKAKGEDITKALNKMGDNTIDFEFLRYMFYLGLKHEDKKLSEEKTGEILDVILEDKGMEYLVQNLAEALTKAFGIKETPGVSNQKKR